MSNPRQPNTSVFNRQQQAEQAGEEKASSSSSAGKNHTFLIQGDNNQFIPVVKRKENEIVSERLLSVRTTLQELYHYEPRSRIPIYSASDVTTSLQAPNTPRDKRGDPRKAILNSCTMSLAHNKSLVDLGVKFSEVPGTITTSTPGEQFNMYLPAMEKERNHVFMSQNPYYNSEFFKKYQGYSMDNVDSKGVFELDGEKYVDVTHPVVELIEANADRMQVTLNRENLLNNKYMLIDASTLETGLTGLKDQMRNNLKMTDMTKMYLEIKRPNGVAWDDLTEIRERNPMLASKSNEEIMKMPINLTFNIKNSYRLPHTL